MRRACNYDEDATLDDGSCEFPGSGLDCDGICLNDADGDGVCDADELQDVQTSPTLVTTPLRLKTMVAAWLEAVCYHTPATSTPLLNSLFSRTAILKLHGLHG